MFISCYPIFMVYTAVTIGVKCLYFFALRYWGSTTNAVPLIAIVDYDGHTPPHCLNQLASRDACGFRPVRRPCSCLVDSESRLGRSEVAGAQEDEQEYDERHEEGTSGDFDQVCGQPNLFLTVESC